MSKFFDQINNIKAGRAKVKAYGDGGTVDALESARDYLREKYNNPEAGIPTKVATTLGLVPVNLARSAARAVTAPARSMTDENFNPEEEAANMAGFVTTGGIGLSKAGLGPKGDVLGMGVGKASEKIKYLEGDAGDAFNNLASQQRGDPELAMINAQKVLGGGVMSHALEHVGDLTHRMSEKGGFFGSEYVRPKVESVLRSLKSGYGFAREHLENMAGSKISPESENAVLNRYANEHSKLPVYNKNQELGRDAAIALGKKDFDTATQKLEKLDKRIKSGIFDKENLNYDLNYEKLTNPDVTKARGGAVHQRALGANLFGLK